MKKMDVTEYVSREERSKLKKSSFPSWIDPRYIGLRRDKNPEDVVRERPKEVFV